MKAQEIETLTSEPAQNTILEQKTVIKRKGSFQQLSQDKLNLRIKNLTEGLSNDYIDV